MTRVLRPRGRSGFTLVELLVVVALLIVIAALTVAVFNSGFISSQRVVSGGDRVGQALLTAKQRAKRDGAARGVRFYLTPDPRLPATPQTSFVVTEFQYIEAPDVWSPNPAGASNAAGARIVIVSQQTQQGRVWPPLPTDTPQPQPPDVYFFSPGPNGQSDLNDFEQRLNQLGGDYLVLPDYATSYRITGWTNPPAGGQTVLVAGVPISVANARKITLANYPDLGGASNPYVTPVPASVNATVVTYQFGFQAAPRPLLGEPTLLMPDGVVVDYRAPVTAPPFPAPANGLTLNGSIGTVGYRDWSNPANATATVNTAPYWPATTLGVYAAGGYFDILFAPNGAVLYNPNPQIVLWVRGKDKVDHPRLADPANPSPTQLDLRSSYDEAGDQVLVTVYVRSGLIATHPVNPPPPSATYGYDPYQFAKDGINSGL